MKKFFLLILIPILASCYSIKTEQIIIDPVITNVEVENSKSELYVKANTWMVESFNNAKSVIQFSDKENGIVIGKYLMKSYSYTTSTNYNTEDKEVYAIIKIQVKENATKMTVTPQPFEIRVAEFTKNEYGYSRKQAVQDINELSSSFRRYMLYNNTNDF